MRTAMSAGVGCAPLLSCVGAVLGSPMMMAGPVIAMWQQTSMTWSKKSLVASPNGTYMLRTLSCHVGPTNSYIASPLDTPRS